MRKLILPAIIFIVCQSTCTVFAQGFNVELQIKNIELAEVRLAYYIGNTQCPVDTVKVNPRGTFVFHSNTAHPSGLYLFSYSYYDDYQETKYFVEFLVPENDQVFKLTADANDLNGNMKVEGSTENKVYFDYLHFLSKCRVSGDSLTELLNSDISKASQIDAARKKLNKQVSDYQNSLISANPGTLVSKLIKGSMEPVIPAFEGTPKEVQNARFYWYKEHYFDNINLSDPALFRTPLVFKRVINFMTNIVAQQADSINSSLDYIFNAASGSAVNEEFLLNYFLNYYSEPKYVGLDACYVHIAVKYFCPDQASWIPKTNLNAICEKVKILEQVMIGHVIPDITLYDSDQTPHRINEIEAEYTVLYFLPYSRNQFDKKVSILVDFAKKYHDIGVKVVTICSPEKQRESNCLDAITYNGLSSDLFMHLNDGNNHTDFNAQFGLNSNSRIYILNRKHEILFKQIDVEQLNQAMESILKKKG